MTSKERVCIFVPRAIRNKLKVLAAQKGMTMYALIGELLKKGEEYEGKIDRIETACNLTKEEWNELYTSGEGIHYPGERNC
jgi:hypothetical protein